MKNTTRTKVKLIDYDRKKSTGRYRSLFSRSIMGFESYAAMENNLQWTEIRGSSDKPLLLKSKQKKFSLLNSLS